MFENIALSFQGIWSHKLRSFLTMLGIIIGIASIITIVSTIKGTNDQIKENLVGSGNNVVTVQLKADGNPVEFQYMSVPDGVRVITEETRQKITELPGVADASLYLMRSWAENVYVGKTQFTGSLYGVNSHYFSVNGLRVMNGRGFTPDDYLQMRKVVVLEDKVATKQFAGADPVGQTMEIGGEPFTVVGVVSYTAENGPTINSLMDYQMYMEMNHLHIIV